MRYVVFAVAVVALGMLVNGLESEEPEKEKEWAVFEWSQLLDKQQESKRSYLPFLNVRTLNCGIYVLEKGEVDRQSPHRQDEVYYVVEGKGRFTVGTEDVEVKPGAVLYVKAGIEHRFHDITEDVKLLVFFSAAKE